MALIARKLVLAGQKPQCFCDASAAPNDTTQHYFPDDLPDAGIEFCLGGVHGYFAEPTGPWQSSQAVHHNEKTSGLPRRINLLAMTEPLDYRVGCASSQ